MYPGNLFLAFSALALSGIACRAADQTNPASSDGPDPKEIPLPHIQTAFPLLPGPEALPLRAEMPPVLVTEAGLRVSDAKQWAQRREEIRRILEHYAVGHAPPAPGNVKGTELSSQVLNQGKVRYRLVHLSFGPEAKLGFDIGIFTPAEGGPFPTVMSPAGTPPGATPLPRLPQGPGQGKGANALLAVGPAQEKPATASAPSRTSIPPTAEKIASENPALAHGYAYVVFNNSDLGEDTTLRNADGSWAFRSTRFYPDYPGYDWGLLRGWAWGVSRIVDFLETDPSIDKTKLIVTGVSRTGKSAMVAGAFDERIAMTAPVVTGGGGIGAFRFSGLGRGGKEGLGEMMRKYPNWFSPQLRQFWGHTDRLPYDAHWFLALCAPRPFIALEGIEDQVSVMNAVKQSYLGAKPAYDLLGVPDRLGVNYGHHGHAFTSEDWEAMLAFADKHLLGKPMERRFDQFPVEGAAASTPTTNK